MRVEEILFDTLKSNTKKLKCFGLLSLAKTTNLRIRFILLDINIKSEQNETIGTK